MYNLKELWHSIEDVFQSSPDPLAVTHYSCVYWVDCLHDSKLIDLSKEIIHAFLRERFLYWLEALSLNKSVARGVASLVKLRSLSQVCMYHEIP
jgi:hypothetical protein